MLGNSIYTIFIFSYFFVRIISSFEDNNNADNLKDKKTIYCLTEQTGKLECPADYVIDVEYIEHGHSKDCKETADENCKIPTPAELRHCRGRQNCSFKLRSNYLPNCGTSGNYYAIRYSCIEDDNNNIVDICGEETEEKEFTKEFGYIRSLNYPKPYKSNSSCECTIASDNGTIFLRMLDVELQRSIDFTCNHDHLDYFSPDKNQTIPLCSYPRTESPSNTESSTIRLNFRSDGESENKGFWLRYSALTARNKPGNVTVQCRTLPFTETNEPYSPSHLKKKSKHCLEEYNGEIFLGCKKETIINIKSAHHYRSDNCAIENEIPACVGNFEQMDDFKKSCMGKTSCHFPIQAQTLTKCEAPSNMVLVEYECIPDSSSHHNVIDICGESTSDKKIRRSRGYLKSLSYPDDYPIDIKCSCNLSVGPEEQILFNLIDSGMPKNCYPDLIEYSVSNSRSSRSVRLCNIPAGTKIHTGVSTLSLNFNSGNDKLSRGFWMQYEGISKLGGKSTVSLKCFVIKGSNDPDITKKPNEEVKIVKDTTLNDNKTAMIAGILIVVLLIFVIIAIIIAHQFRRRKLLWKQSHLDTPVYTVPSRSERTLCTLRSVPSTYPSPYSTYTNAAYNENLFIKKNIEVEEDSANYVKM